MVLLSVITEAMLTPTCHHIMDSSKVLNTNMSFAQTSNVNQSQMALSPLATSTSVELSRRSFAFVKQVAQEIWVRFQLRDIWLMGRKCSRMDSERSETAATSSACNSDNYTKTATGCKSLEFPHTVVLHSPDSIHRAASSPQSLQVCAVPQHKIPKQWNALSRR